MRREQFHVLMKLPAIHLVLDPVVWEMHAVVEVRQIVLACPVTDFVIVAARPAVAVRSVTVVVLQELLILALQVVFENDASNLEVRMLVSKTGFFLTKRRVEIRVVIDLP
jgi:hypothetical protein